MASILVVLIGAFLFGLGGWILWMRLEGMFDRYWPTTLTIGQVTIDGAESKGQAEILRARFDLYFRSTRPISSETGFLDVVTLGAPQLFQPKGLDGTPKEVSIEVAGVNVWRLVESLTRVARPPVWLVEADFTSRADRVLLALRLRRGPHVVRTWYLERLKTRTDVDAASTERLTDDAIFQIVHDFWTDRSDPDLARWRRAIPPPKLDVEDQWPNAAAVAAYFRAQGALGRYYQLGDWKDLDAALEDLRTLRVQMPDFPNGLQLLGMALAERGEVYEATHVYGHLRPLLQRRSHGAETARVLSIDLLQATATAKLHTWQAAHQALRQLLALTDRLRPLLDQHRTPPLGAADRAAYGELHAHCAVQLAYTFALYLEFLQYHTITEVFGSPEAPTGFALTPQDLRHLQPDEDPAIVRATVTAFVLRLKRAHEDWIHEANQEEATLTQERAGAGTSLWQRLEDGERRRKELSSRKSLARAYAEYRMAEWERRRSDPVERSVFGSTYEDLLHAATADLREADGLHPNHYRVLQLLALASSDPRDPDADLSVAEQYVDRAIRANPFDTSGHELLAAVLLRRVAHHGIDWDMKSTIEAGLAQAKEAVLRREFSFAAQLLRTEFQTALLVLETAPEKRRALQAELEQDRTQAQRFMPKAFSRGDPELAWVEVTAERSRMREEAEALDAGPSGGEARERKRRLEQQWHQLRGRLQKLLDDCNWYEAHWVPNQRLFSVGVVKKHVESLLENLEKAPASARDRREEQLEFL